MTHTNSSVPERIDLWFSRCGAATASALAIRQKWLQAEFDQSGTALHSLRESEDREVLDAHYHHQQFGLFREGGNIPPIWARARGSDTVVLGITWLDEYQGVLSRRGSGIERPGDLKGKRLGLPLHANLIDFQRGAALHGFVTALRLAGLRPADAHFVDLPVPSRVDSRPDAELVELAALREGRVDAIFLRFARGVRASRHPDFHQVINLNEQPDPLTRVNNGTPRPITVDRPFLEKHPELVVRYLAVLLRSAAWAEQHPREVVALLSREGSAETVDEVLSSHGSEVHRSFTPNLSPLFVEGLELQKNFLRDHGFLATDFEIRDWVAREPLALALELVAKDPRPLQLGEPLRQSRIGTRFAEESLA